MIIDGWEKINNAVYGGGSQSVPLPCVLKFIKI